MRFPDFFIVGAPKCGTTALAYYLRQHPHIFIPEGEIHFLSQDFPLEREIKTWEEYASIFAKAPRHVVVGEKSVSYLYSEAALQLIKKYNSSAKIIILLRNPVQMMYSLYLHLFRIGVENALNFEEALMLETERAQGQRIPKGTPGLGFLFYRRLSSYHIYVRRYMDAFPKGNLRVYLYEEFFENFEDYWRDVLEFLDVDSAFRPLDLRPINKGRSVSNPKIFSLVSFLLVRFPIIMLGTRRKTLPRSFRNILRKGRNWFLSIFYLSLKMDIDERVKEKLEKEFLQEANLLAQMLDKDVASIWFPHIRQNDAMHYIQSGRETHDDH